MWSCSAKEKPEFPWALEGTLARDSQILGDKEAELEISKRELRISPRLGALGGGSLDKAARGGSLVREAGQGLGLREVGGVHRQLAPLWTRKKQTQEVEPHHLYPFIKALSTDA